MHKCDLIFSKSYLHELLNKATENQWQIYAITESDHRKSVDDKGSHIYTLFYDIPSKKNSDSFIHYEIKTIVGTTEAKEFLHSILNTQYILCDVCQSNFEEYTFIYFKSNTQQSNMYETIEVASIEANSINDWLREASENQWEIWAITEHDCRNSLKDKGSRKYTIFYSPLKEPPKKKKFIYWIKSVIDVENAKICIRKITKYGNNILTISESNFSEYTFIYKVKACAKTERIELEEL